MLWAPRQLKPIHLHSGKPFGCLSDLRQMWRNAHSTRSAFFHKCACMCVSVCCKVRCQQQRCEKLQLKNKITSYKGIRMLQASVQRYVCVSLASVCVHLCRSPDVRMCVNYSLGLKKLQLLTAQPTILNECKCKIQLLRRRRRLRRCCVECL